ncbi:hypothetical protein PSTT_13630 [Puccinia striiformis]|uniref:Uncharacterized protein n=1 Tax=Puccinia striiformis TaxID=27350 RepID=A0A2S4UQU7_9BASI|nr:hypothetical protein PSTT_13630 [Puccinia striiformis]
MDLQVCTCTACIKQTITTPDGEAIPGSWVHPSTRRRHWAQNSTPQDNHRIPPVSALPSIPPPNETSPASEPDSEPAKTLSEAKDIYYFIAWLSLVCGVSQANCRIARDWIIFIIKIFQKLPRDRTEYLESYKDSRTITKHLGLDPEIESSICCTKCFSLYEHEDAPNHLRRYPPPFKPFTPRLVYHTQPFNSWLKWFLNVPGIEDEIFTWREKVKSTTDTRIVDIQQSKAWRSFQFRTDREPARNELRLTFSVFIDWLNPFSNKLAGRQVSMGVIALTCLDLSPQSRNKHNNIFIAGIIPAPKEPDMTTISHILAPLVDELLLLNTGTFVNTPQFPGGRKLSVHLGVLIGDMVATHKIAGFASHAATLFCSWCQCLKKDMMHMQVGRIRTRRDTRSQAIRWRDSDTLVEQKRLLTLHGTRWSELNRLPYWDPVKNVALGVMHNWYEGVLQHHWRVRWAFEPEPSKHLTHDDQLDDWEDDKSSDSQTSLHFQDNALAHIRKALPDIIIPRASSTSFVDNPAKCATDNNQNLLLNFSSLVICTNIVSLKSINDSDSNKLAEAYSLYTKTIQTGVRFAKNSPNHHYALHLPEQMKWWGPLSNVSEFSGQIEGTVLREFCQTQRLNSQAPRWSLEIDNNECDNECDNESQAKPSRLVQVHPDIYMAILQKLQSEDPTLRHYQDLPHPDGSRVVTPYANEEDTFKSTSGLYISKTKQNRLVAYQKDGHTRYVWVTHVYSLPDFNNRILVAVKALADACTGDAINIGQSFLQTLNDLELKVVQENPNRELLDPGQVIAVCAYRHLPAWTFRYHLPLVVLRQMPHDLSHLLFPSSTQ